MFLRRLVRRTQALLARRRLDSELDDEMRFHLEMEVAKLSRLGMSEAEARSRAHRGFGATERFREECRDARGLRPLEDLTRDLRLGLRTLVRRPGFTVLVLGILGLSVGATSAMFGTVEGILLTPLPFPDAERVMTVWQSDLDEGARQEAAPANFLDWRQRSRSFERLAALEPYGLDWQSPDGPVYLHTWLVSEGFFDLLGAQPLLGRTFRPDEHTAGRAAVVVLGYRLWQQRFAGDPALVGRILTLDEEPHTVVGIMPEGFAFPGDDALWAPKVWEGWESNARSGGFYTVFGRLAPDVTAERAQAEMDAIAAQLAAEHPSTNARTGAELVPLVEQMVGGVRRTLWLLLGAVILVLAIAAANVASLQLARAAGRQREFQVRGALGAGRGRLIRQLLAENLLLGAGGAALGVGVARLLLTGLRAVAPAELPRLEELRVDGEVMLFAAAVSLLVALTTGLVPVLFASRRRSPLLPKGARATRGRLVTRSQGGLLVAQIGISLVLLVGAGLLLRSFVTVLGEDRGFRTEGVVTLAVQSWSLAPEPHDRVAFVERTTESLAAIPGVRAVGMTSSVPLMESIGAERRPLEVEGQPPATGAAPPDTHFSIVTPGLFEALDIPLRRGRLFDSRDHADAPAVAVVNEALVRRYWPHEDPIGRHITQAIQGAPVSREIVGVVGDVRHFALHQTAAPAVFVPHAQAPTGANAFVVWADGRPAGVLESIRRTIWDANPTMAIYSERTMTELVGAAVHDRRFLLALLGAFAITALTLAAAGIFALMSYTASERTREIGVRMAFGAHRGDVTSMMVRFGATVAAMGIGLGLLGALATTRLLVGALYGVAPLDPIAFAAGALLLLVTALAASWLPARRAAGVDPVVALRAD